MDKKKKIIGLIAAVAIIVVVILIIILVFSSPFILNYFIITSGINEYSNIAKEYV